MSTTTVDLSDPMNSAEFAAVDVARLSEIAARHQRLAEFLRQENFSAVLLQQPSNFTWFTAGGCNERGGTTGATGALFVTPEARVLACSNVDTAQFFESEVSNMGFQLKERPWTEPRSVMLADLCRGRRVASDAGFPGTTDVGLRLLSLRLPLSEYDQIRMREGAKLLTHAIEATARAMVQGRTEAEIAGEVSHRLFRHGVQPERIQVLGDGRGTRFRRWTFDESPVQRYCTISAVGRYCGMYVGAARTVALGEPPESLLKAFEPAAMIAATGVFFSQPDWELFEVWNRVHRLYEKSGVEAEWRLADQAEIVEYEFGAVPLMPNSEFRLMAGTPVFWHPSVGPVLMGDTVLVGDRGTQVLTSSSEWPVIPVLVKGTPVDVPAILVVNV
ncbi:MAG: M24 family metallopeptidase [Planctomycetes bacterium]|nr:M24 family metallopeptidase [Planctomycetota bacterium]